MWPKGRRQNESNCVHIAHAVHARHADEYHADEHDGDEYDGDEHDAASELGATGGPRAAGADAADGCV